MKLFATSEDILQMAMDKFEATGLMQVGLNLKVMSTTKSKDVLKVSKASATTQFLSKNTDIILVVYEEAFDRLPGNLQAKLMEGALSNVSYDNEKDKINVDTSQYGEIMRMRQKYEDYVDIVETAMTVIQSIEEEEKKRKEMEKAAKQAKKLLHLG